MSNEYGEHDCTYLRLERSDPERHNALHIAPTLFGGWDLVREWGRIGSPGTLRIDPFETREESERAFLRIAQQKRKRGYI